MLKLGVLISCGALLAVTFGCEGPPPQEMAPSFTGIIGGRETNYETWQSAVLVQTEQIMCTGTLIHARVVLTAGHCVRLHDYGFDYDFTDSPRDVAIYGGRLGDIYLAAGQRIAVHPDWDGIVTLEGADLALILLETAVTDVAPSRLRDFPAPAVGDPGIIVGYGFDAYPNQGGGIHREGNTTILTVDPYLLEIGGETNTCSGDSGGPLFTEQAGQWVVTGVTSFGLEECPVASGGYDVNLLSYCAWLNKTMTALVGDDLGLVRCTACDAPSVSDWGEPCGPGYSCCPTGTRCRLPVDYSRNGLGFCAPDCCAVEGGEVGLCGDVAAGEELCGLPDDLGDAFCAIHCEGGADCKEGTTCKNKPFESEKICIATETGPGSDQVCDTEPDTETQTQGEEGEDAGVDESDRFGSEVTPPSFDSGGGGKGELDGTPHDSHGCVCGTTGAGSRSASRAVWGLVILLLSSAT